MACFHEIAQEPPMTSPGIELRSWTTKLLANSFKPFLEEKGEIKIILNGGQ